MSDIESPPDSPVFKPQSSQSTKNANLPWIEKYRPKRLDDVAHQEEVVQTLKRTLQSGNLPHLLLYGPPGTGKTSTIIALARDLYGPELMKKRVLELNASNERGIDVIRHKVREFAQVAVGSRDSVPGYPCPPFKIIILDECDSMTADAQSALRRTMEQYSKVTRFAIICNYVSRIIEPLTSRCAKFRYKPLSSESMIGRLETIAKEEKIQITPECLSSLVEISGGDMRKSITVLQSCVKLCGTSSSDSSSSSSSSLTPNLIYEVSGLIPPHRIGALLTACKTNSFRHLQAASYEMIYSGYSVDSILSQLSPVILNDPSISDLAKSKIFVRIGESEHKLIQGADQLLQLLDVAAFIARTIQQV